MIDLVIPGPGSDLMGSFDWLTLLSCLIASVCLGWLFCTLLWHGVQGLSSQFTSPWSVAKLVFGSVLRIALVGGGLVGIVLIAGWMYLPVILSGFVVTRWLRVSYLQSIRDPKGSQT